MHIKCNGISTSTYDKLCEEDNDESFICIKCFDSELPFGLESETTFSQTLPFWRSSNLENLDTSISKQDKKLMNLLKMIKSENNDPKIKNSSCRYYSIDEL